MLEENQFYTYGLVNPLKPSKESYIGGKSLYEYEFFYFGYSVREERIDEHLGCSKSDKNYHKKNTIKEIQRNGKEVLFVKLLVDVDKRTAINKEIEMIAYYGREDKGLGPLTNMTDGGENMSSGEGHPCYGKTWYNNGIIHKAFIQGTEPDGWGIGRISSGETHHLYGRSGASSGKKWYNDGVNVKYFFEDEQPIGWKLGRLPTFYSKGSNGLKWYNNGTINKMFKFNEQPEDFILGRLKGEKNK